MGSSGRKVAAFHQTVSQGKTQEMEELLGTSGFNVNICNADGVTALHFAASCRKFAAMRILLCHNDISPNVCDKRGKTALHLAVSAGHLAGVKQLCQHHKIDINIQDEDGRTPLHEAIESKHSNHCAVLQTLLDTPGTNVNVNDKYQRTALAWAMELHHEDMALIIISSLNISSEDIKYSTVQHRASRLCNKAIIQALANQNYINFNAQDTRGRTPLHYAAEHGSHEMVEIILRTKPDLGLRDTAGKTAVELAADNRHEKAMVQLLEAGTAIPGHHELILQWIQNDLALMENDLALMQRDTSIMLLQWAASEGWIDVATILLRANYRHYRYIKSKMASLSLIHLAIQRRHGDMVKFLVSNGVNPESRDDKYGRTPLLLARQKGYHDMVMLLLEQQVVLKSKSRLGKLRSPKRIVALPDWNSQLNKDVLPRIIEETEAD